MGLLLLTALSRSGKRKILRKLLRPGTTTFVTAWGFLLCWWSYGEMIYRVWGIPTRSCTILHDLARSGEMIYRVWGIPTRSCTILHDLARSCIALNIFALAQESQQGALHCITLKTIHYAIHYGAMQCQNVREPYLSWFRYITCLHTYRDWDMHKQIYQQEYWCIYIYTLLLL